MTYCTAWPTYSICWSEKRTAYREEKAHHNFVTSRAGRIQIPMLQRASPRFVEGTNSRPPRKSDQGDKETITCKGPLRGEVPFEEDP
eukprot:CAMPEP_0115171268 /NCGR_PEP_ID=MMETSP0270-20121206/2216_1 /TAXON_ID=71861 /ORGANISM="Scrippsiella trochoidea, Strain CCMP3099" /LENGTH=86 /DNA_ID=CAMNT_0002584031 /DNA_START=98 /DNA_END=359 /DNA_ORIENTATION=+